MSPDRDEYFFDFSLPFSIFDDNEILNQQEATRAMALQWQQQQQQQLARQGLLDETKVQQY